MKNTPWVNKDVLNLLLQSRVLWLEVEITCNNWACLLLIPPKRTKDGFILVSLEHHQRPLFDAALFCVLFHRHLRAAEKRDAQFANPVSYFGAAYSRWCGTWWKLPHRSRRCASGRRRCMPRPLCLKGEMH